MTFGFTEIIQDGTDMPECESTASRCHKTKLTPDTLARLSPTAEGKRRANHLYLFHTYPVLSCCSDIFISCLLILISIVVGSMFLQLPSSFIILALAHLSLYQLYQGYSTGGPWSESGPSECCSWTPGPRKRKSS